MRGPECDFSFADLFEAAYGRQWTDQEELRFQRLSQLDRNEWVTKLAALAPQFTTQDKVGTDGIVYRAFWVEEHV